MIFRAACFCLCSILLELASQSADWLQYLGPNSDNSSPEAVRTNWTEKPPTVIWRKAIGTGWSSIAASATLLAIQEKRAVNGADREFCVARDPNTGNELWARDLDVASNYSDLSGYDNRIDGPRSTPTIDAGRVYVLTSFLKLFALDAANGATVWSRDFVKELGSTIIPWENAASPLIVGDLIYVNSNASATGQRLIAVRKSDGVTVWKGQNDRLTHATPVFASIGGVPQIIFLTNAGLVGVTPDAGAVLWRLAFSPSGTSTAASPAVSGEYVHASAAYASGEWIGRVVRNGSTFTATQTTHQVGNAYQIHWSTPVSADGYLYTVPSPSDAQGRLACLNVAAGTNTWTQTTVGSGPISFGSVIKAANTLIVMTEAGELVLVQPNPAAYTQLAKFQVLSKYCWNHVTLANGRIYARNAALSSEMVALDVAAGPLPLPPMAVQIDRGAAPGAVLVSVRTADGSAFAAGDASRVEIRSSPNPAAPNADWQPVPAQLTFTNQLLRSEIPAGPEPAKYFRSAEKAGP